MLIQEGFSGAIFMTVYVGGDAAVQNRLKSYGYDYTYAYNYGANSMINQLHALDSHKSTGLIDVIPTISQGWGPQPWGQHSRKTNINLNDWRKGMEWIKTNFMTAYGSTSLSSRMLLLGNWNEIAEGHELQPSNISGFGYLDELRRAFTINQTTHTDLLPGKTYDQMTPSLW